MLSLTGKERAQFTICDVQQYNTALDRFSDALVAAGIQVMRQAARSAMESIEICCGKLLGFNRPHRPGQEVAALPIYSVYFLTHVYGCTALFATERADEYRLDNRQMRQLDIVKSYICHGVMAVHCLANGLLNYVPNTLAYVPWGNVLKGEASSDGQWIRAPGEGDCASAETRESAIAFWTSLMHQWMSEGRQMRPLSGRLQGPEPHLVFSPVKSPVSMRSIQDSSPASKPPLRQVPTLQLANVTQTEPPVKVQGALETTFAATRSGLRSATQGPTPTESPKGQFRFVPVESPTGQPLPFKPMEPHSPPSTEDHRTPGGKRQSGLGFCIKRSGASPSAAPSEYRR